MPSNIKEQQGLDTLKKNPELFRILMKHLRIYGPPGGKVAVIQQSTAIDEEINAVGVKTILSLSALTSQILQHQDLTISRPPSSMEHIASGRTKVIFEKPNQLIVLAGHLGIPLTGALEEQKEEFLRPTGTTTGQGRGGRS